MRETLIAALAAAAVLLCAATGDALAQSVPGARSEPAIILGPPPAANEPDAAEEEAERDPPPIARKKPQPPKRVSAPKRPRKAAPAKKAPQRKAPARAATTAPPQQAKECDYCYGCEAAVHACRRQWVCGKRYADRLAAGLCRR